MANKVVSASDKRHQAIDSSFTLMAVVRTADSRVGYMRGSTLMGLCMEDESQPRFINVWSGFDFSLSSWQYRYTSSVH